MSKIVLYMMVAIYLKESNWKHIISGVSCNSCALLCLTHPDSLKPPAVDATEQEQEQEQEPGRSLSGLRAAFGSWNLSHSQVTVLLLAAAAASLGATAWKTPGVGGQNSPLFCPGNRPKGTVPTMDTPLLLAALGVRATLQCVRNQGEEIDTMKFSFITSQLYY